MSIKKTRRNQKISFSALRLANAFQQKRPDLKAAAEDVKKAASLLCVAFRKNAPLFVCGNGGSFSDALHIKGELGKSFERRRSANSGFCRKVKALPLGKKLINCLEDGLPVVVLGESGALRSAFANDRNPLAVYAQELHAFLCHAPHSQAPTARGVFIGISTSGKAVNVLAAASTARAHMLPVITLVGPNRQAPLAQAADIVISAPGTSTAEVQENHLPLYHLLCRMVEEDLYSG
jgi:D-sedoheptulose 7-phosphate isomerase